jgi:hypothetical protein
MISASLFRTPRKSALRRGSIRLAMEPALAAHYVVVARAMRQARAPPMSAVHTRRAAVSSAPA